MSATERAIGYLLWVLIAYGLFALVRDIVNAIPTKRKNDKTGGAK